MSITAQDVANMAEVSVSTVSRVLSAPEVVAPGTRSRVLAAVEKLGYQPNRSAQSLISGRTSTLGLIVPDMQNPYFAALAKGIQKRAWESGYLVVVADSDEDIAREKALLQGMNQQVDGLLLSSLRSDMEDLTDLLPSTEIVLINREMRGIDSISQDNIEVIRMLTRHLGALGHRQIAYIGGPKNSWSDAQRRRGLEECRQENPGFEFIDLGATSPTQAGGYASADFLIASEATAVICFNDLVAVGVLERLRARKVAVPEDFSVAGIDNVSVCNAVSPTLTSVGVSQQRLGRTATELMLQKITRRTLPRASGRTKAAAEKGSAPTRNRASSMPDTSTAGNELELPIELVVRDSTGPLKAAPYAPD